MLKVFESEQLVAQAIVDEMEAALNIEEPVYCLASGSTPSKGYALFAKQIQNDPRLEKLKIVSLDEWVGVEQGNVGSCYQMLNQDLFSKIALKEDQVIFYDGTVSNLKEECQRIDDFIKKIPITFSLMGVGMNGHVGLNEPDFPVLDHSSVVELSETTKIVAQKYFNKQIVLKYGITLGLHQIVDSKRVIVVITGSHKAEIVKDIFMNNDVRVPAEELLGYDHIDFYLDKAAAKYLDERLM